MAEMVIVNGVRYKPAEAKRLGLVPDPDPVKAPAPSRRPANKARKQPEPVETESRP